MNLTKMSNFSQRLWMGSISAGITFLAIYLSVFPLFQPVYALFWSAIALFGLQELFCLAKNKGFKPLKTPGLIFALLYLFSIFFSFQSPLFKPFPELILLFALVTFFLYHFIKEDKPFVSIATSFFCLIYIAIPIGCAIQITYLFPPTSTQDGRIWLIYLLLVVKVTDIGAYFFGKRYGKKKLAPYISPKKTWEGALGGAIASMTASFIYQKILRIYLIPFQNSTWMILCLTLIISLFAQFGDLAESLLKREAGIKDSSQLPGLGGVLDVLDSLIFTLPLLYLILKAKVEIFL